MRWLFADPTNVAEMDHRNRTLGAIDAWWRSFQAKTTDLDALFHRRSEWDLAGWMHDSLGAVHSGMMWEFGRAIKQPGHRLVITPEMRRWLRPVVRTLFERAPTIRGWEFYPHRLAEDVPQTILAVEARTGVNITGAVVAANIAPARKIDLWFDFPAQPGLPEQAARNAAFVATETLMGEQVLDTWIGGISLLSDDSSRNHRPLPMERAQATVGALIQSIHDQLPTQKLAEVAKESPEWSSVTLEPEEQREDYVGRTDLIAATVLDIEMFRAAHTGMIFTSACHSRMGEWFVYLKLDALEVPNEERVDFRAEFEDALDPALLEAGAGCVIGGGSGLRYSYIDLALSNIQQAVPIIRRVLAAGRAPLHSWIQFFDDDLAAEWIGIYAHTPPPLLSLDDD
ncbi:MAG: hypothetical protein MUF06_21370 [Pirellulaceae bacterium]|jgi:hypothetical protein|nr:hypothetical protein [Pirellulaceae bacterium]